METGSQRQPPFLPGAFPGNQGPGQGRGARTLRSLEPPGSPLPTRRSRAAAGGGEVAGEAAKIQLSREGVGEMDALRAEARAEPQIRGRRLEPETFSPGP